MRELLLFAALWVITFPIAWKLLPDLLLVDIKNYRYKFVEWVWWRLFYIFIILLPYLAVLAYTDTSGIVKNALVSLAFVSFLSALVKIFFANKIQKFLWHIYGYVYDGLMHFYPYRNLLQQVASRVMISAAKNGKLLDLGCGTGNLLKLVASEGAGKMVGVDSSTSMLRSANKKLGSLRDVKLVQSDLLEFLEQQDEDEFDVVSLVNVLYTQKEQKVFLQQINRVLKPGGMLVISDPDRGGNWPIIMEHLRNDSGLKLLNPRLIAVWIIDNFISALSKNKTFVFNEYSDLMKLLAEAGFTVVSDVERTYGGPQKGVNLLLSCKLLE